MEQNENNDERRAGDPHGHFAGRTPAGTAQPVTLAKNGQRHIRLLPTGRTQEILSVGLACSECFSGPNLARLLRPGLEYEMRAMEDMANGNFASPLSIHTSSGVPPALEEFLGALRPHLPWKFDTREEEEDWMVSLQIEGASAVWAAVDMLLQIEIIKTGNRRRKFVAVGARSYHGPPATSFGGRSPLWNKSYQLKYPVPAAGVPVDSEALLAEFSAFLDRHGDDVGVMLIEPQWGSSQCGLPWPEDLLRRYVRMAQARGVRVVCDEIMCGLGRHGKGTLFLAEAWDLNVDAVTFGKSIGGGVFPLSGCIVREGKSVLSEHGRSVMQSHTFAASSARALMAGTAVLSELPRWFPSIGKLGEEMSHIFRYLESLSGGMITAQGHGLMWGCLFTAEGDNSDETARAETVVAFKRHCEECGVLPYFVPVGGFMVTPVVDVDVGTIYEIGTRLEEALRRTMKERGWKGSSGYAKIEAAAAVENGIAPSPPALENESTPTLVSECSPTLENGAVSPMLLSPSAAEEAKRLPDAAAAGDVSKGGGKKSMCLSQFHATRSCTSCTDFVCRDVRMRFLHAT